MTKTNNFHRTSASGNPVHSCLILTHILQSEMVRPPGRQPFLAPDREQADILCDIHRLERWLALSVCKMWVRIRHSYRGGKRRSLLERGMGGPLARFLPLRFHQPGAEGHPGQDVTILPPGSLGESCVGAVVVQADG